MATTSSNAPGASNGIGERCRCCPYGFHIDLDFVDFAEDVVKGQSRTGRTPTLPRRVSKPPIERTLTSPLESIFSDSLENIMSDFEEVLDRQPSSAFDDDLRGGFQNGYQSDFTGYRRRPVRAVSPQTQSRAELLAFDLGVRPPASRSSYSSGARGQIQKTNTAYTALGRTLSEMKARQSMETLVENNNTSSTTGRLSSGPIDMSVLPPPPPPPPAPTRFSTRSEHDLYLPPKSPRNEASSLSWRRNPVHPVVEEPQRSNSVASNARDFASLRRGRESALPEGSSRVRYYSASPKLPRRFTAAPPLQESSFAYSTQNGHTVLSRHQATSTSPRDAEPPTRSVSVGTGPLPPAKPCIECPQLKKQLKHLAENPPEPSKPATSSACVATDPAPNRLDACVGADKLERMSIAIGTEAFEEAVKELRHVDTQADRPTVLNQEAQTQQRAFISIGVAVQPESKDVDVDTADLVEKREKAHFGCNTEGDFVPAEPSQPTPQKTFIDGTTQSEKRESRDSACGEHISSADRETMTPRTYQRSFHTQTSSVEVREFGCSPVAHLLDEYVEQLRAQLAISASPAGSVIPTDTNSPSTSNAEAQTESEAELLHELSEPRLFADNEVSDSLWLMLEKKTIDAATGPDVPTLDADPASIPCTTCVQRENVFTRNVGVGACTVTDKVCANCDEGMGEVDENEVPGFSPMPTPDRSELTKASATKKLLEQKSPFVRGTGISRSCRLEKRSKSGDELEFIENQHNKAAQKDSSPSPATVPSVDVAEALTAKVVLKKEVVSPTSKLPDPIPARIPRPKISKYAVPHGEAETPDEAEEAQDRLTPLRSELRTLGRWNRQPAWDDTSPPRESPLKHSDSEDEGDSDGSEGTYECQENEAPEGTPFELSTPLREALDSFNAHLHEPGSITTENADWALKYVQHEWLKTAARKGSQAAHVEAIIEVLKELGPTILKTVINMTDQNGNSALHYAVSHGNFAVVSTLLDSGECQLNMANKAGYTPVMLAALSNLEDDVERAVVHRLFQAGDVNARATQHGQTALMLAVSHGKRETTQLLLENSADVNIQDEEGSTALMCAAEHGHRDLVKLLLAQPNIDAALADCDASTALSIAVENGHRDIGVLIYAHLNYARADEA